MCSGRRRSNGRRIEMEKSPAAPKRCRIILCPEFAGAFLLSDRVLRDCTPRALPRASRAGRHVASLPAMTNRGSLPFNGACTSRQRCAGSGMPLPYNSGCGRRNCFKICNCQWRSGSAATDAIGLYVFVGSPFESAAVRRAGLSPPIQHLTILRRPYFTYAARNCRVRSFFGWRNSSSGVPDSATTPRSRKMT